MLVMLACGDCGAERAHDEAIDATTKVPNRRRVLRMILILRTYHAITKEAATAGERPPSSRPRRTTAILLRQPVVRDAWAAPW